jgi:hypothetical protein
MLGKIGGGIIGAVGGYLGGKKIADGLGKQGALMQAAGQKASNMAQFKPVAMVATPFGSTTGTGGYTVSPEIQALQQQLSGLYSQSLGQAEQAQGMMPQFQQAAQGLLGLGQQYISQSPEQARQQFMSEQMAALRPYDIEEEQRLASSVFGRGRGGLSVGAGGQPELQALSEARNRRNLQLAAAADQAAQQRIGFGAGLFGQGAQTLGQGYGIQEQALAPTAAYLGLQEATMQPARQQYLDSLEEARLRAAAGAQAGSLYMGGAIPSAQAYGQQAGVRGGMLAGLGQGLGSSFSGLFGSSGGGTSDLSQLGRM